jgi:hypothetical protein
MGTCLAGSTRLRMGQLPSEAPGEAPSVPNLVDMMSTNAVRSMSHKRGTIKDWFNSWHAPGYTSDPYTDVLCEAPDERLSKGLRSLACHRTKPDQKQPPPRETEPSLFRFVTGRAFTGEYA